MSIDVSENPAPFIVFPEYYLSKMLRKAGTIYQKQRGVTPENRNHDVRRRGNNNCDAPIKLAGPSRSEHDELSFSRILLEFFLQLQYCIG
jgi:hypothetical protein